MAERNLIEQLLLAVRRPLELITVSDRGIPGQERIYLKTHQRVNLSEYVVLVGFHLSDNYALPLPDHSFWLGAHTVDPEYWIIVYTGPGEAVWTRTSDTKEPALVLHWGKPTTIFNDQRIVPCLVHIDMAGIQIGRPGS